MYDACSLDVLLVIIHAFCFVVDPTVLFMIYFYQPMMMQGSMMTPNQMQGQPMMGNMGFPMQPTTPKVVTFKYS